MNQPEHESKHQTCVWNVLLNCDDSHLCTANQGPPGGVINHQLHWLLHIYLLSDHHTGDICNLVVSIPPSLLFTDSIKINVSKHLTCAVCHTCSLSVVFAPLWLNVISKLFYTFLVIFNVFICVWPCRSVSTIRNQRYHIHANLSFAILVAQILLLISFRFDPGTVSTS